MKAVHERFKHVLLPADNPRATIVIAKSTKPQIGKVRNIKTGEVSTGAAAKEYHFKRYPIKDLATLTKLLQAVDQRYEAVIPGDLIAQENTVLYARRLSVARDETDEKGVKTHFDPVLEDYRSSLMILDIDNIPVPPGFDFNDRDKIHDRIIRHLPECLQATEMLICCTSSHGLKGTICARVFLFTDTPLTLAEKQAVCADHLKIKSNEGQPCYIDPAVFRPAQLAFVGATFIGGDDPFPKARFFVRGFESSATITDEDLYEPEDDALAKITKAKPRLSKRLRAADAQSIPYITNFDKAIRLLKDTADHASSLHDDIVAAARAAFRENPLRNPQEVIEAITEAVRHRQSTAKQIDPNYDPNRFEERIRDIERNVREAAATMISAARRFQSPMASGKLSVDQANAVIADTLKPLFDAAERNGRYWRIYNKNLERDAPVLVDDTVIIRASPGAGKTKAVFNELIRKVYQSQQDRPYLFRAAFCVLDKTLQDELHGLLEDEIGNETGKLLNPVDACRYPTIMRTWLSAYGEPAKLCKHCDHRNTCPFPNQDHARKRVVSMSGEALFRPVPEVAKLANKDLEPYTPTGDDIEAQLADFDPNLVEREFDILIVDETAVQRWINEVEVSLKVLNWMPAADMNEKIGRETKKNDRGLDVLKRLLPKVRLAIADAGGLMESNGMIVIPDEDFMAGSDVYVDTISDTDWKKLAVALWEVLEKVDDSMAKMLLKQQRRSAKFKELLELAQNVRAWHQIVECFRRRLDGYHGYAVITAGAKLRLVWRKELADDWKRIPVVILDGTANVHALRQFFPKARIVEAMARDGEGVRRVFHRRNLPTKVLLRAEIQEEIGSYLESQSSMGGLIGPKSIISSHSIASPRLCGRPRISEICAGRGALSTSGTLRS